MTYLEIVNNVLYRLREPEIISVLQHEDPVVNMVKALVNDARRYVENAHRWNATRQVWVFSTELGINSYVLDDTANGCVVDKVMIDSMEIRQFDMKAMVDVPASEGVPYRYAFDGTDNEGNVSMMLAPMPKAGLSVQVLGHRSLPDLHDDTETLRLPPQPVIYYALALAARERGEVGGQTATELMGMAQGYIRDAVAIDANLSPTENTWVAV